MLEEIPIECYVTREGNLVKFVRYEKLLELQARIDKAIEYIENETTYSDYKEMDILINILRGEDNK